MKLHTYFKASAAPAALGLALLSQPAMAQDTGDDAEAAPTGGAIVVTGSRIARPDVESASPVTVVGAQEVADTGTVRVEDLVNSLPQVLGGQNAFVANGASGTATVDLRGLGTARTLVLVNGRRLQPGDPALPAADLNQIPASLIERVEVLTGGASATYGADAVAGVVNFVMDTDFEGVRLDATYGFYQHNNDTNQVVRGDGQTVNDRLDARGFVAPRGNDVGGSQYNVELTIGSAFDDGRGHVTGYVGYREVEALLLGDRDYSFCALTGGGAADNASCGGSANAINATVADPFFNFFGALVADGSDDFSGAYQPYNYNPINHFQRPDTRYTAGFFGDYEISPAVTAYAEFMFMDDRSQAQIAQSGTFFAEQYNLSCDSPLFNAAQGDYLCGLIDGNEDAGDFVDTDGDGVADTDPTGAGVVPIYIGKRNIEGGPRFDDLRHTAYRIVAGLRGPITDSIRYDASFQYGTTIFQQKYNNDFSVSRLRNALQATTDADGNVVCQSVVNGSDPNCVVYNPFQGAGIVASGDPRDGITQAAIDYVSIPLLSTGEVEEVVANAYIAGDLVSIGNASPIGFVLGAEYREELISTRNDVGFQTQDGAGQGSPQLDVFGKFDVKEVFGELRIPLIEDGFVDMLALELGYRYSDYSTGNSTDTYKILAEFAPVDWIKFRGGYNRAVRAPNILNLFAPNRVALFGGNDPCAGATPDFTVAQCVNLGVPAARYGTVTGSPAAQYNQFIGGNPNAEPEKADTYTVGVVIEPDQFIPGLTLAVDYYDISVDNAISTLGAQTIINQCGLTGDPFYCDLVTRAPGSLTLWTNGGFVTNTTLNVGGFSTSGVDIAAGYNRSIGAGRLNFQFNGTWLNEYAFDTGIPTATTDGIGDCAGYHGTVCGTPAPEWRHTMRLGYTFDFGFGASVRWRHFGAVDWDQRSTDGDVGTGAAASVGDIGQQNYFDLTLSYDLDPVMLRLGVNNIFDKEPPIMGANYGGNNGNTYVETYDPVGRRIFMSATLQF
ncbi:TonB-dependent receptor domain-containing protein [Qipengyuania mesophila]|uniref:TonB-dependent receptor domain-containing protein n=1 Tax=Qipengyuania mesophila TaxID=2867246 RepID=UPI0035147A4D